MACKSCLCAVRDLAEELLMNAESYDSETRLVKSADLLKMVQGLNAGIDQPSHDN